MLHYEQTVNHLVVKFGTNASCATCWPNLEQILVVSPGGKFWTNTSGTTYNWPNLEPMQVALYLAEEITQIKEAISRVRCASGNVWRQRHGHRILVEFLKFGLKMEIISFLEKWPLLKNKLSLDHTKIPTQMNKNKDPKPNIQTSVGDTFEFPNSIFEKCTRLACLLSFCEFILNIPSLKCKINWWTNIGLKGLL